jgi:hypothetical protein
VVLDDGIHEISQNQEGDQATDTTPIEREHSSDIRDFNYSHQLEMKDP